MRFAGAGLCVEQMLLRRCGIRGPLGTYDGAVARAENKTQGPFEWVFLEPIPVFVYDYVSKPVPVLRLLILDRAKTCLSMFEISAFAIKRFLPGETWTKHVFVRAFLIVPAVHFCSKWLLCCLEAQDPWTTE